MITLAGLAIAQLSMAAASAPTVANATSAAPIAVSRTRCDATVDDNAITNAILSRLSFNAGMDSTDVRILAREGVVEIRGLTRTEADKASIAAAALDTYGVVRVNDRLDVVYWRPLTDAARASAKSRDAAMLSARVKPDAWITSAVRYTLSFSRAVGTCAIDVSSVGGSVALRGEVADQAGYDKAVALVSETLGVRSVDATGLAH